MSTPHDGQPTGGQIDPLTGEPIPAPAQPQFAPGLFDSTAQPGPVIPEPRRSTRALKLGALVTALVLAGGGATWAAAANGVFSGAQPVDTAKELMAAVAKNDLVGILDKLHPAEAKLFREAAEKQSAEYKRLGVYKPEADPIKLPADFIKAEGVEFAPESQQINDRLAVHTLVKGKITVNPEANDTANVYTEKFQKLMNTLGGGAATGGAVAETKTIDLEKVSQEFGQQPTLATVKVGGTWYASFFYTLADNGLRAAKKSWPQQSIPAKGADSPEQAVREVITSAVDGNYTRVIELLPAEEMAVLHDMGQVLAVEFSSDAAPSAKLVELETKTTDVPGGKKLSPTKVTVEVEGRRFTVAREGDCVVAADRKICVDQLLAMAEYRASLYGVELSEAAISVLDRVIVQVLNIGVVTVEQGGKHYLSPINTVTELGMSFLRTLKPEDIDELIKLGG